MAERKRPTRLEWRTIQVDGGLDALARKLVELEEQARRISMSRYRLKRTRAGLVLQIGDPKVVD